MNVSELKEALARHGDSGFGGDSVVIYDDDGNPYEIVSCEPADDGDVFVINVEDSGE